MGDLSGGSDEKNRSYAVYSAGRWAVFFFVKVYVYMQPSG